MLKNEHMIFMAGLLYDAAQRYIGKFPDDEIYSLLSNGRVDKKYRSTFVDNRNLFNGLALDSGTWTLNKSKKCKYATKPDFRTYLTYLKRVAKYFDFYFNYDEDFSTEGYWINQEYQRRLEQEAFKPIYVIHDTKNRQEIDFCLKSGYDMVAIGSGELRGPIDELRETVNFFHNRDIKVHFLGCTKYERLATMPVYSCDSSTWTRMGSDGYVLWWNPAKSDFDKTDKIYFKANGPKSKRDHYIEKYAYKWHFEDYLRITHGLDLLDLKGKSSGETLVNRAMVNMKYFVELQDRVRIEHKTRNFVF